jgi:hypothetical protein
MTDECWIEMDFGRGSGNLIEALLRHYPGKTEWYHEIIRIAGSPRTSRMYHHYTSLLVFHDNCLWFLLSGFHISDSGRLICRELDWIILLAFQKVRRDSLRQKGLSSVRKSPRARRSCNVCDAEGDVTWSLARRQLQLISKAEKIFMEEGQLSVGLKIVHHKFNTKNLGPNEQYIAPKFPSSAI